MDHLPRPFGIKPSDEDRIPFLAFDDYHGSSFLEYPEKYQGYQIARNMGEADLISTYETHSNVPDLERFLQTWLFFGLLKEALKDNFKENDFVNDKFISTVMLSQRLYPWVHTLKTQSQLVHLFECLKITCWALIAVPKTFHSNLKIGIAATAETIGAALQVAASINSIDTSSVLAPIPWGSLLDLKSLKLKMQLDHGWCPAQASFTIEKFNSLQTRLFFSKIRKPFSQTSHGNCSDKICRVLQMDKTGYQPLHNLTTCKPSTCKDEVVDQEKLVQLLKSGSNVLLDLQLGLNGEISVHLVEGTHDSEYIALSHVCADGLGNVSDNTLPQCQIRQLYDYITMNYDGHGKRPYLWLDTLCCPANPDYKPLVLDKIPEIYQGAARVLILDSSLTEIPNSDLQAIEIISRIFCSGWIFRLWTLSEANMTSKLCLKVKEGIMSFGEFFLYMFSQLKIENYVLIHALSTESEQLKIHENIKKGKPNILFDLVGAMKRRSISETPDESICIGTILGLDIKKIVGDMTPGEDKAKQRDSRMTRTWDEIRQKKIPIPKSLIFHVGERLASPGFRWAPSTLLNVHNTAAFYDNDQLSISPSSSPGCLPEWGLPISSAACSVSILERVDGNLAPLSRSSSNMMDLIKYDDDWLQIYSTPEQKKSPSGYDELALFDIIESSKKSNNIASKYDLLFERPVDLFDKFNENCLMVAVTSDQDIRQVRFVRQAGITKHNRTTSDFLNLMLKQAQALQEDTISKELLQVNKNGVGDPKYQVALEKQLEKIKSIVDQMESDLRTSNIILDGTYGLSLEESRRQTLFAVFSRFYRNRYLIKEQEFPPSQVYCVD